MAANLLPITSDGGFTSGGNINSFGDSSASPSLNDFFSITSAANFAIVTDNANTDQTWTFDDAGNLTLPGNTFAVNYANGDQVSFGAAALGNVTFDDVTIQGVNQLNLSWDPLATANLSYLQVRGGDVASHIHLDTGNNNAYDLIVGDDQKYVQVSSTGDIIMSSYDGNTSYTWTLDTTGNLILAGGESVIQSVANSSLDPINPNVSTMILTPSVGYSSQSLVLDPTAPGHIHLRAPGANIDEPLANIFLGGEESSFEIGYHNGNAPNAFIHSGGNTWTFDNGGNLVFPRDAAGNTDPILTIAGGATPRILSADVSLAGPANLEINAPNAFIHSGGNTWTFDNGGNLVFPRDTDPNTADPILTIVGGANPSITSTDASLAGPANLGISALNTIFTGFSGDAIKIYPDDGEIGSTGNLQIWSNSGGNTEYSWTFDTTGNLTLPGNAFAINYANGTQVPVGVTQDITSNGAMSIMLYDGNIKYNNYATVEPSTGNITGGNISTTGSVTANIANITTGNITTINSGLLQNGNSNITITSNGNVSIQAAGSNVELVVTSTGANVNGTLTSTGKIGYASGSTVTQTTNRGNGVTINALAGTIITTSATMVANQIDTFSVANDKVDPNNDIVLVQIVSPNFGVYNVVAQPSATISVSLTGFYVNIVNISGFTTSSDAITIRFMVIKAPNA
jgi:hypothetical protein